MIKQYITKGKLGYFVIMFVLILQIRCSPETSSPAIETVQVVTPASTNRGTSIQTSIPTVTQQSTVLSTSTSNHIVVSPEAITTPTSVVATVLPTPTLTKQQKAENLTMLLESNGGCELPCWWGITPGESTFEAVKSSFEPLGFRIEDNWLGSQTFYGFDIDFEEESEVIQSMQVSGSYAKEIQDANAFIKDWEPYSLYNVLNRYGLPTGVKVYYPFRPDPGSEAAFNLFVFYEALGIVINYVGDATDVNGGKSRACPALAEVFTINLFLYQPGKISNVLETIIPPETVDFIAGPETVYDLISWEQATDTTLESFYETFRQPDSEACFDFRRYWTSNDE